MRLRRFRLCRRHDVSGVSGTGHPAEGVEFSDGSVALRWTGDHPATSVWPDITAVLAIHGHNGATVIEWIDDPTGNGLVHHFAASCRQ
ncbi:hypothetical protein ACFV9C_44025 [Kribbella sp. NPDC059898]|uniref:hypothetical protein n=1 Tax=Kribbella sp. NPDC059898 TaxID=3346995 RepID=UPI0036609CA0